MSRERRRELTAAYKERKARPGVFAVRCAATGAVWVAAARELANRQNGVWFTLRMGSHRNRVLQAAWTEFGEPAFAYEELEALDGEGLTPWALDQRLKDRQAHWLARLGAASL